MSALNRVVPANAETIVVTFPTYHLERSALKNSNDFSENKKATLVTEDMSQSLCTKRNNSLEKF
jgi:hypothetical protein